MLELLISILMTLGIQFTVLDTKQVEISSADYAKLQSSDTYIKSDIDGSASIVINDGVDPVNTNDSKQ